MYGGEISDAGSRDKNCPTTVTTTSQTLPSRLPHTLKQEATTGAQNMQSLAKRRHLVGEEHDTELADDVVELLIGEWQRQSVRFLPLDPSRRLERNVLDTGRRWVV